MTTASLCNQTLPPRPLLESLNLQSTFAKRKKKKIFPSMFFFPLSFFIDQHRVFVVERRDDDNDRLDASPGKVRPSFGGIFESLLGLVFFFLVRED